MSRKTNADKTDAQASATTAAQQDKLPAASTTDALTPGSDIQNLDAPAITAPAKPLPLEGDLIPAPVADAPLQGDINDSALELAAGLPAAPGMTIQESDEGAANGQLSPSALELRVAEAAALRAAQDHNPSSDATDSDVQALWIRSISPRGFRRLGQRFTPEGHALALSALTEEEIEILRDEPNLRIELATFSGLVE